MEEGDRILFIEYKHKDNKPYFSLPGGGQEKGVNLKETVQREFREEVGIEVEAGDVLLVRSWIGGIHQIEIIFECKRRTGVRVDENQLKPDFGMIGFKWIPIDELGKHKYILARS